MMRFLAGDIEWMREHAAEILVRAQIKEAIMVGIIVLASLALILGAVYLVKKRAKNSSANLTKK